MRQTSVHVASKSPAGSILLLPIKPLNSDLNFIESTPLYTLAANFFSQLQQALQTFQKHDICLLQGTQTLLKIFFILLQETKKLQHSIFLPHSEKITVQGIQFKRKIQA